jgi:ribosomal protein L9
MIDCTMIITLITATAAVFGVTMASYMNKGRYENTVKIQKGFLREKYTILKELGVLDNSRAIQEIEEEFTDMETDFDNEKSMANQEITYEE